MDAHLTFADNHNRCLKTASTAEAPLHALMRMQEIVLERTRAGQIASVQGVVLNGSELWWDPLEIGRREDLQHLLDRQARSPIGALPTMPMGALMTESGLPPTPVALDATHQRFTARLACTSEGSKPEAVHDHPTSAAPICRVTTQEHKGAQKAETMRRPNPDEKPGVKMVIPSEDTAANREAIHWARERDANEGARVRMWWTYGSQSDDSRMGAATVCKQGDRWKAIRSNLGTGRMEVHDAALWAMRLALRE